MGAKKQETEINLGDLLKNFKINPALILLFLILCFGFYLRFYHYQYPMVGYHNWKSAHYATEARNFARDGFFKEGFFVPMRDTTNAIEENPSGAHYDTFPTTPIIVAFFFKIFGISIGIARIVNILLSVGSILVFYLLIKELFEREDIALLSAFLAAINPLYVFFSHNVQVVNPGLLLMLLGCYYYIRWIKVQLKEKKYSHLYWAVFFIIFSSITKYTFAFIIIPILFTFPYRKFFTPKEFVKPLAISLIIALIFPAWFFYSEYYVKQNIYRPDAGTEVLASLGITKLIDFSILGNSGFWTAMRSYIADNYTLLGMTIAIFGSILLSLLFFTKNRKNLGYRFMFGFIIEAFAFLFIMGYKLSGHNYHQFPVAPLVVFLIAFFIDVVSKNISGFFKGTKQYAYIGIVIVLLVLPLANGKNLIQLSEESKDRMFDTQFPGLDIAGAYINTHSSPNEKIFHSSHQSFGIVWEADRKGYKPPRDVEYFKEAEDKYDVSWVFVYQGLNPYMEWGLKRYCILTQCDIEVDIEVSNYLKENYRLVQFAFVPDAQQPRPLYLLFRKGGSFNESRINEMLQNRQIMTQTYYMTSGPYQIGYINLE